MYLIFRCSCGRATYAKEGVQHKTCVCGKTFKVRDKRILKRAPDADTAAQMVRELQEEKYGGGIFTTADKIR
jgi:predicted kinase